MDIYLSEIEITKRINFNDEGCEPGDLFESVKHQLHGFVDGEEDSKILSFAEYYILPFHQLEKESLLDIFDECQQFDDIYAVVSNSRASSHFSNNNICELSEIQTSIVLKKLEVDAEYRGNCIGFDYLTKAINIFTQAYGKAVIYLLACPTRFNDLEKGEYTKQEFDHERELLKGFYQKLGFQLVANNSSVMYLEINQAMNESFEFKSLFSQDGMSS